jgi:2-dehydro-3-deoxygluconokinase
MELSIKPKSDCRFDMIALGEVMLRLDPCDMRVSTTRSFDVYEGGGEYNVARGLKRCFGLDTAVVTALVDNPVGRLLQDLLYQGGVDQSYVRWVEGDGIGRTVRNGLNFTERGFGLRGAVGCSDRGNSAASQMRPGEVDWERIFARDGVRWFHTGGIFAGLSQTTAAVAEEAMKAARANGTVVSFDLNYRPSLWKDIGGHTRAREVNRSLAQHADVMIGNEEDFTAALGFEVGEEDGSYASLDVGSYERMIEVATGAFPNFAVVATTLRRARTATRNDWGALCWHRGRIHHAASRDDLEIFDRVGGGDSFASGLIFGFLSGRDPQWAVDCGAAHGALAMTTPGDTTMVTLAEVEKAMKGLGARVER